MLSNQLPIEEGVDSLAIPNSAGKEFIVNISLLLLLSAAVFMREHPIVIILQLDVCVQAVSQCC